MAEIVVIDYGSGNVHSVLRALEAVGSNKITLSDEKNKILNASHIVLPGVGAFEACYKQLIEKEAPLAALQQAVLVQAKPFLGICVGAQLVAQRGLEWGSCPGLGWMEGESAALEAHGLALPHMGWNNLKQVAQHFLFDDLEGKNVYFANSFALRGVEKKYIAAKCSYGEDFCAAVQCGNIIGTQFHPEKSQTVGLDFLEKFSKWTA
jgi:glutamine amidotransferase